MCQGLMSENSAISEGMPSVRFLRECKNLTKQEEDPHVAGVCETDLRARVMTGLQYSSAINLKTVIQVQHGSLLFDRDQANGSQQCLNMRVQL